MGTIVVWTKMFGVKRSGYIELKELIDRKSYVAAQKKATLQDLKDDRKENNAKPLAKKERYSTSKTIRSGSKV